MMYSYGYVFEEEKNIITSILYQIVPILRYRSGTLRKIHLYLAFRFSVLLTLNTTRGGRPESDPRPAVARTREPEKRRRAQPSADTNNPERPISWHKINSPETKSMRLAADYFQATPHTGHMCLVANYSRCLYRVVSNRQPLYKIVS